jgi:hypothetical protein
MKSLSRRRAFAALTLALAAFAAVMVSQAFAGGKDAPGAAQGLGQLTGLLPRDHLTEESAIQVDLNKETVRLPLYKGIAYEGTPQQETVWYVLLDASDAGLAHDLGQTGPDNPNAQGFVNIVKDGHASEDASAGNTALIDGLRNGGDLLNVFGDFPTLSDPRHADAYSPLWDAQLGLWTDKAVKAPASTPVRPTRCKCSTLPPADPT